ncbi:hypothetical protein [Pseudomonas sp. GOM6]|nr:hypothetical protein [Pseudomonas sp. GOM6]MDG1581027.1 hypothetical protein [Pseudomonas sp. GOM6]
MSKVQAFLAEKDALILGLNAEPIPAKVMSWLQGQGIVEKPVQSH